MEQTFQEKVVKTLKFTNMTKYELREDFFFMFKKPTGTFLTADRFCETLLSALRTWKKEQQF